MTTPNPLYSDPNATTDRFSGIYPNNTYPLVAGNLDAEQEKRKQTRDESARTRRVFAETPRAAHPPFTERGPDAPKVLVAAHPTVPTYNETTKVLTIPVKTGIQYFNTTAEPDVLLPAGDTTLTESMTVEARPTAGYRLVVGAPSEWTYTYTA